MPSRAPAAELRVPALIGELRDILLDIYQDREPDFQDFVEAEFEYEYALVVKGDSFRQRMQHTLIAFKGDGGLPHLLALAEATSKKKYKREDLKKWVQALQQRLTPTADDANPVPPDGPPSLPPELELSLQLHEQKVVEIGQFVRDVRQALRARDHGKHHLFDRYHLGDAVGQRALVVLQLEVKPDLGCSRWLAERVTVEPPEVAFLAAKALTIAALRFARPDLSALGRLIDAASGRLDLQGNGPNDAAEFVVAARKKELMVARTLIDMRSTPLPRVLSPDEVEQFLSALQQFDRAELEAVCTRSQTLLKRLARPTDPLEHLAVNIAVNARDKDWEADLLAAAAAVRPDEVLKALTKKYTPSPPAGI